MLQRLIDLRDQGVISQEFLDICKNPQGNAWRELAFEVLIEKNLISAEEYGLFLLAEADLG